MGGGFSVVPGRKPEGPLDTPYGVGTARHGVAVAWASAGSEQPEIAALGVELVHSWPG